MGKNIQMFLENNHGCHCIRTVRDLYVMLLRMNLEINYTAVLSLIQLVWFKNIYICHLHAFYLLGNYHYVIGGAYTVIADTRPEELNSKIQYKYVLQNAPIYPSETTKSQGNKHIYLIYKNTFFT